MSYIYEKQVSAATKWSFRTEILAKLIVPITNAILAHLLMPSDFGLIATINMIISFTDVLTESGFGQFLIQHDFSDSDEYERAIDVAFWCNFSISMTIWLVVILIRIPLASLIGSSGHETPLVIACAAIPLTSFSSIPIAVLQRKLDYKSLFFNRIAGSLTPLIVSSTLALLGLGYWSLIIGTLCSHIIKAAVLIIRSKWHPHLYFSFSMLKMMLSYSSWILLEAIAMWACTWADVFIVSRTFNAYYVGIYKTAQATVTGILSVVTASLNSIVFVTLSKLKNDLEEFRKVFYEFQRTLAIVVIPMGVGILVFSPLITFILLGPNWGDAAEFLGIWGVCMSLVATLGTFCREALRAYGLPKTSFFAQLLHLAFIIPIIIWGANIGYRALIYMRSFAYLQIIIMLQLLVKKRLNISPFLIAKNTIWPIFCAALMGAFGYHMRQVFGASVPSNFLIIAFCIVLYFSVLSLLPAYREQLRSYILKLSKDRGIE